MSHLIVIAFLIEVVVVAFLFGFGALFLAIYLSPVLGGMFLIGGVIIMGFTLYLLSR